MPPSAVSIHDIEWLHRAVMEVTIGGMIVVLIALTAAMPMERVALVGQEYQATDFEAAVAPILIKRCLECHNGGVAAGKLVLATPEAAFAGGASGPVVVPGKPEESFLMERIEAGEMPPMRQGRLQPLPPQEIAALRAWIAAGAPWPDRRTLDLYERTTDVRAGRDWWSLQPVVRPDVPRVRHADRAENPIDAFIWAKLDETGMEMAPSAEPAVLARRVSMDVLGLPPAPEQVACLERDRSPPAYEALVDQLLAAPQFGERWARYWLDVVRFAETCGYERDQEKPAAWKYRDWVVQSLNSDKPYDRFVQEQLSGDELPDRTLETVTATGFLRLGTWNDEPNDPQEYKYERLEDMVDATASAFLGMTVKCARCHDHKFDPIPQRDYYRLANAFWAGSIEPRDAGLLGGPTAEELGFADVLGWTDRARDPPPLHLLVKGDPRRAGAVVEPGHLSMVSVLDVALRPPPDTARSTHRRSQLAHWITDPRNPLTARVLVNRLWQHHFGQGLVRSPNNFGFLGEAPTHPELLDWLADELVRGGWSMKRIHRMILLSRTYRQSSQHPRQGEYAQRDPGNRLWWRAARRRLDAEGLRDAMLSSSGSLDLRMGGPSFRPAISAEALEGLSRKAAAWVAAPPGEQRRRSIYMYTQRSLLAPLMTTFDFCDTTVPCGQRDVTIVAPQALALLNNAFVHEQSQALARRVVSRAGFDETIQVHVAWELALGRRPTRFELEAAQSHLQTQRRSFAARRSAADPVDRGNVTGQTFDADLLALTSLCHVLLNTNEFIYVD